MKYLMIFISLSVLGIGIYEAITDVMNMLYMILGAIGVVAYVLYLFNSKVKAIEEQFNPETCRI